MSISLPDSICHPEAGPEVQSQEKRSDLGPAAGPEVPKSVVPLQGTYITYVIYLLSLSITTFLLLIY